MGGLLFDNTCRKDKNARRSLRKYIWRSCVKKRVMKRKKLLRRHKKNARKTIRLVLVSPLASTARKERNRRRKKTLKAKAMRRREHLKRRKAVSKRKKR